MSLLPVLLMAGAATQAQAQACSSTTVLFAAPAGNGSGGSWADATSLQAALGTANADTNLANCYEIRLKQGIYKPTSDTADRSATFAINRPLQLKGGYSGYTPDERGSGSNTVLSGDIDSNDLNLVGGVTQKASDQQGANSYHVILIGGSDFNKGNGIYGNDSTIATYTLLDGLSISAGNATSGPNFSDDSGGGIYCNGRGAGYICSPSITNMTFSGNKALYGGAVINSSFSGGTSNPSFINTTFSGNAANANPGSNAGYGGAIFNDGNGGTSNSIIANCTFSGNSANVGGAIHSYGNAGSNITGSILWGNTANSGKQIGSNGAGSVRNNLVQGGYGTVCTAGMDGTCNLDKDPLLGALADNVGPTQTLMPQSGSPAIDAYTCTTPITDQRGVSRPQGAKCDVGAVERIGSLQTLSVNVAGTGTGTVSSSAGSISGCTSGGGTCAGTYSDNTTAFVTLNATTQAGSAFTGWSGDACVGNTSLSCNVTMDAAKTITASFSAFNVVPPAIVSSIFGTAYSARATATGSPVAYTFAQASSTPAGLSLGTDGTISGASTLAVGSYMLSVTATDANGAQTNATNITVKVTQTAQTLTVAPVAPATAKVGSSYVFTVTPGASTTVPQTVVSGPCTLTQQGTSVSFDAVGTCTITTSQGADANFTAAPSVVQTVTIAQAASGVTITSTPNPSLPGQEVTFTITVALDLTKSLKAQSGLTKAAAVPTGTVTLTDGATTLGTATLDASGNATLTVKTLSTLGAHSLVASYSGDVNYPAVQSAAFTQTVNAVAVATPVPLFGELWEKLLLSLMMVGVSALLLRMRRTA